ncbi:Mannosyltransferase OCH1 or related enzyme (OCH1) [Commensalibacter communis]|uniref:hypothetical protein n=1 Tax=Commensalibacter communis TaxID=2972786 RepID=UPI0022FFBB8D|nr:hypothetical protein [Commensalibacter communis]CAI3957674.1 Mannosyltransferase OCH1 or related enzyme (OCH1) [Commensalibacter communis]CAI3958600.1 Mannosyltransferase OCH1 or related enzyme (OCH1) [Commensalibacter communis]
MEANQSVDYTDMLSICPQALEAYQQRGVNDVIAAYDIGNILITNHFYGEAAFFYKLAYNMHSKSPSEHPLSHVLWMIRMVALLKGGFPLKDEDLEQLKGLSIPFYNYVTGWKHYKDNHDALSAVLMMGNCYEEFPTGEGADRTYLSIMMDLFNFRPQLSVQGRTYANSMIQVIPNNLFMYWDEDVSEDRSNFEYHQQLGYFNCKIFSKTEAVDWLYQNYGIEARQLFLSLNSPVEAEDFLRVHVINQYGGWWLGTGLRIKSVEQFCTVLPTMYEHVFFLADIDVVHNDFFGSVANSPILNECIRSLYHNCYVNPSLFPTYKTGPGIFNRAVNRNLYRCLKGQGQRPSLIMLNHQELWWQVIETSHSTQ